MRSFVDEGDPSGSDPVGPSAGGSSVVFGGSSVVVFLGALALHPASAAAAAIPVAARRPRRLGFSEE